MNQVTLSSGFGSGPTFIADDCQISFIADGVARLVFTSADGRKLASTGHGAVTPAISVGYWQNNGRHSELCLPVMEDRTGIIYWLAMLPTQLSRI